MKKAALTVVDASGILVFGLVAVLDLLELSEGKGYDPRINKLIGPGIMKLVGFFFFAWLASIFARRIVRRLKSPSGA
jgi:hypothetical protein